MLRRIAPADTNRQRKHDQPPTRHDLFHRDFRFVFAVLRVPAFATAAEYFPIAASTAPENTASNSGFPSRMTQSPSLIFIVSRQCFFALASLANHDRPEGNTAPAIEVIM